MFYSGNDNYMQDLYFYNQIPNQNTYNGVGMNNVNMQNPMMNNGMYMNSNPNLYSGGAQQQPNINTLYPSTYRILMPVVSRVVANSNCQYLNEDVLDNMVDTVFNITEGQINYENETEQVTTRERNTTAQTNTTSVSQTNPSNNNTTNVSSTTTRVNNVAQTSNNPTSNSNDSLLRDIIKILIIREILFRRQFPNSNMQNNNMNMYSMNNGICPYCNM